MSAVPGAPSSQPSPPPPPPRKFKGTPRPVTGIARPVTGIARPVTGTTNPVSGPLRPVSGSSVLTSDPVSSSSVPVSGPTVPVLGPSVPVSGPSVPVSGPTIPVSGPSIPVSDSSVPVSDLPGPVSDITDPVSDSTSPVSGPTGPVSDISDPVSAATAPVSGTTVPVSDSVGSPVPVTDTSPVPVSGNSPSSSAAPNNDNKNGGNNDDNGNGKGNGKAQVKPFTKQSLERHENKSVALVRDYGFQPRRKLSVQDGSVLPGKYEPFPAKLYGRPLEEIDHFIYDETFCVVSKRFKKNYIHRFTATRSFFCFSPFNPARRACIFLSTNQYFDYVVMATILLNCVFLAMTETVEEAEYIFLAIYSCEMVIKCVAKGFILNKYTYLRNPWNWLDFVVITSGYATIGMEVGNLAGLRTFRVLRALKTISILPGLKTIINALLHSFKQLAEVMTLTIFCLMVFALFALQVYMGELRNKCVLNMNDTNATEEAWSAWTKEPDNWLWNDDELPVICGNVTGSRHCPTNYTCICVGPNPNHGYTNFDNFLWSMLTTFQLITLDYWENVYNMVLSSCGPISVSFFTVVVFFGSFYLINLMLAVVALSYEEEAEITQEERRKDLTDHREDSTFSFDPSHINVKKLAKHKKKKIDSRKGVLLASYSRKKTRRRKRGRSSTAVPGSGGGSGSAGGGSGSGGGGSTGGGSDHSNTPPLQQKPPYSVTPSPSPSPRHSNSSSQRPQVLPVVPGVKKVSPPSQQSPKKQDVQQQLQQPPQQQQQPQPPPSAPQQQGPKPAGLPDHPIHPCNMLAPYRGQLHSRQASSNASDVNNQSSLDDSGVVDDHEEGDVTSEDVSAPAPIHTRPLSNVVRLQRMEVTPVTVALSPKEIRVIKCNGVGACRKKKHSMYTIPPDYLSHIVVLDDIPDRNCAGCSNCCVDYAGWLQFQNGLYKVVRDPLFELAITLCIVLNTIILALEHHGMSEPIRQALDIGNKVFTSIFTFECILKLMALSKEFFQCGWNIFDLIIVSASLLDLIFELVDGLSVLRGLRLLRVLKLAQSWTTMKVLLSIIISTIGALGNLTFVLVIVIYIFAVIGMQLFSKDYTPDKFEPDPVPRWNFNDFFHSFMMIFRILCGEWIEPLWDCMRAEKLVGAETCFAVFLPALVMGNFMVLNLFLALLLNSFNSEELKSRKEACQKKDIGEQSKLARSFERIRDIVRKKRMEKEKTENEQNLRLEQIVREVMHRHGKDKKFSATIQEIGLPRDKIYNRSYQEALNRPISGSDFNYEIVTEAKETQVKRYSTLINGFSDEEKTTRLVGTGNGKEDGKHRNGSKLMLKYSSGLGTIQADSKDDTNTESIEMRLLNRGTSADTDPEISLSPPLVNNLPEDDKADDSQSKDKTNKEDGINKTDDNKPWHTIVSYVDELTVGGRRNSKGQYIDGMGSFPFGFGRRKNAKMPADCFPQHCYEKCPFWDKLIATKMGQRWVYARTSVLSVVDTPAFEWFVLVLIFASSITLCFEDIHLDENPDLKSILYWTNLGFCVVFVVEMVLKWIALGFSKYFTSFWTILDFVIVFVSFYDNFSLIILCCIWMYISIYCTLICHTYMQSMCLKVSSFDCFQDNAGEALVKLLSRVHT